MSDTRQERLFSDEYQDKQNRGEPTGDSDKELVRAEGRKVFEDHYYVYILRCGCPFTSKEQFKRRASLIFDGLPNWWRMCFESNRIFYIGSTEDLFVRLGQHWRGSGSKFTKLCEPRSIDHVEFAHGRQQAEHREEQLFNNLVDYDDNREFHYQR